VVDEFVFDETKRRRFAPHLDGPGIDGITVFFFFVTDGVANIS
jgi:hypothetical protein